VGLPVEFFAILLDVDLESPVADDQVSADHNAVKERT
jgi:hypothetical protein